MALKRNCLNGCETDKLEKSLRLLAKGAAMKTIYLNKRKCQLGSVGVNQIAIRFKKVHLELAGPVTVELGSTKKLSITGIGGEVQISTFSNTSHSSFFAVKNGMHFVDEKSETNNDNERLFQSCFNINDKIKICTCPLGQVFVMFKSGITFITRGSINFRSGEINMSREFSPIINTHQSIGRERISNAHHLLMGAARILEALF